MLSKYKYKILVAIIAITVAIVLFSFHNEKVTKGSLNNGEITIIVIDDNELTIHEENYYVNKKETLFTIMFNDESLEIGCNNKSYTNVDYECSELQNTIREIKGVKTDWYNSYWQLFINDKRANAGISTVTFDSGDTIEFRHTSNEN